MAAFIGMEASAGGLLWATLVSTADAMRNIEEHKGVGFFEKKYAKVKERAGTTGAFHFVRSASVGRWREAFSPADLAVFSSYAGPTLARVGYD